MMSLHFSIFFDFNSSVLNNEDIALANTAPRMQARGKARRDMLLLATKELLAEKALDEISLADIADRADIPTGSAYHFFSNTNAVFEALARLFGEELDHALSTPVNDDDVSCWLDLVDICIDRSSGFYAENPGYRELILGGKTPPEIKFSDSQHDQSISSFIVGQIEAHFLLPKIPRREEIFFNMVEVVDLFFMLSYMQSGEITHGYLTDAKQAAHAYLRIYLPEELPRRP